MARHRIHSLAFKKQVVQEYAAGATLNGLAREHDRPLLGHESHNQIDEFATKVSGAPAC